jgi:hypothetical protein
MLDRVVDLDLLERVNKTGIAFVHIPKTGGTSIGEWLYERGAGHRTWEYFQSLNPAQFEGWLKIAVIRDPIDRFLSSFDYLQKPGRNFSDRRFARRFIKLCPEINTFVDWLATRPHLRRKVLDYFHFRPQTDYVVSEHRQVMVNRLVPFERMGEELPRIVRSLEPLPVLNKTTGKRTPKTALSATSIEALHFIYAADFALYVLALSTNDDTYGRGIDGMPG